MTGSLAESLASLTAAEQTRALRSLTDAEAEALLHDWAFWARPAQLPPAGAWKVWLLLAGRGYGKTRVGAEIVRLWAREFGYVNLIAPTAADARDVMILGESGIMAVCPDHERPSYRPSLRRLDWPSGCRSLIFSAEDPESLRGPQHEKLWADEVAAWQYVQDTWDLAMMGLRLGTDPQVVATTTPKPIPLLRDLIADPHTTVTKGTTYENLANLAPAFADTIIARYKGTRLGRQELEAELLLDEGLAFTVRQDTHLVAPFPVPDAWLRFESMDFGSTNPTAWLVYAVDYDGNVLVFDIYYSPGLVAHHAHAVHERRRRWWPSRDGRTVGAVCYAPPDIKTRFPKTWERTGTEISVESEFAEHGIGFAAAQNDRRAGYQRIAEMLRMDEDRVFPVWHPRHGETGAPRLYIVDSEPLAVLVQQLRDAPLEDASSPRSRFPGEAVDVEWESSHGHAVAALRYGLMSRPAPSRQPAEVLSDPRAARVAAIRKRVRDRNRPRRPDLI